STRFISRRRSDALARQILGAERPFIRSLRFLEEINQSWRDHRNAKRHLNVRRGCSWGSFDVRGRPFFSRFNCPGQCSPERGGKIIRWARREPCPRKRKRRAA